MSASILPGHVLCDKKYLYVWADPLNHTITTRTRCHFRWSASRPLRVPVRQAVYMRALRACRTPCTQGRQHSGQAAQVCHPLSPICTQGRPHKSVTTLHSGQAALRACRTPLHSGQAAQGSTQGRQHSWHAALVRHQLSPMQSPRHLCIGELLVRSSHKHVHDSLGLHPDTTASSSPRAGLSMPRGGCG